MRVIIAAGGTAGHINPALAIAAEIKKNEPDSEILFVGRDIGMEKQLVERAGYKLFSIDMHGFERKLSLEAILFNINSVRCMIQCEFTARKLFKEFKPDIVIGCGGFVTAPIVKCAAHCGIKTLIQEQNAFPGVTNRMLARYVDAIMVANEDAVNNIGYSEKCFVTGNPVREQFFLADRDYQRRKLGIGNRPCIISFGGSLGAATINEVAAKLMARHCGTGKYYHIHATGQYAGDSFPELLKKLNVDYENCPDIKITKYIDDMPECLAAADLVISRSGAITVSELEASGTASVLIPSPNVTENHQYHNAMVLGNIGAAMVFEDINLDTDMVVDEIEKLCDDRAKLIEMGVNARSKAVLDTVGVIYKHIKELTGNK